MSTPAERPRILLTNDDGIAAPGLRALFEAARALGDVEVVAPGTERSACSHTLTLHRPIEVRRVTHEPFGPVYTVDGTPADCVRLAIAELLPQPPDLVLSGINRGANSGVDVYYSGTVAGAREAAILGVASIALSQAILKDVDIDWRAATRAAVAVIADLLPRVHTAPAFWNVNFPPRIPDAVMEHVRHVPVAPGAGPLTFSRQPREAGVVEFRYGGGYWDRRTPLDTDYEVIRAGGIAVTALGLWG